MSNMSNDKMYSSDKFKYKVHLIGKIPAGVALVSRNLFTGEVKMVSYGQDGVDKFLGLKGWYASLPWVQTKYFSTLSKPIDYAAWKYMTMDRIMITIDLAAEVRIVDNVKYELKSSDVSKQLKIMIDSATRKVIASKTTEEVVKGSFNLQDELASELIAFKYEYGVEITKLKLQNVVLPPEVQKSYESAFAIKPDTERIREVGKAEADATRQKDYAEIDKKEKLTKIEIDKIKDINSAEVKQVSDMIDLLTKNKDLSPEQLEILSFLAPSILAKNTEFVYLYGDTPKLKRK